MQRKRMYVIHVPGPDGIAYDEWWEEEGPATVGDLVRWKGTWPFVDHDPEDPPRGARRARINLAHIVQKEQVYTGSTKAHCPRCGDRGPCLAYCSRCWEMDGVVSITPREDKKTS